MMEALLGFISYFAIGVIIYFLIEVTHRYIHEESMRDDLKENYYVAVVALIVMWPVFAMLIFSGLIFKVITTGVEKAADSVTNTLRKIKF